MSAQGLEFSDATAPGEDWIVVPLEVHHGQLPMEPRRGIGVAGYETYGSSIAFLFARELRHYGDLDATIACVSPRCTLIARITVQGARISVEEAADAHVWKHKVSQVRWH